MFLSARAWRASEQQVCPEPLSSGLFITTVSDVLFQEVGGGEWSVGRDVRTCVESETAVKVTAGNLVRPWSWVTWQVHVGIRLTRKALLEMSRVSERSRQEGRTRGERVRRSRLRAAVQRRLSGRLLFGLISKITLASRSDSIAAAMSNPLFNYVQARTPESVASLNTKVCHFTAKTSHLLIK